MTPGRPLTLSGALEINAEKLAERVAELVLAGLADRHTGEADERLSHGIPPAEMPPRGTVRYAEYTHESKE